MAGLQRQFQEAQGVVFYMITWDGKISSLPHACGRADTFLQGQSRNGVL
jgi:hypothetical protein